MALATNIPESAFVNQFPTITITGTPNAKLLFSLKLGGIEVLDKEVYYFDPSGMISIRFLGNTLEKHFYDANYDIRNFALPAVFTLLSGGESINRTANIYFCRTYVSGDKLDAETLRSMPLTRCSQKRTLINAQEYLPFISKSGTSVSVDVCYSDAGTIRTKVISLYTFQTTDAFQTIDVSASAVSVASEVFTRNLIYWDVYRSGNKDKKVRYILDKNSSFAPTIMIFQNCFGAVESFLCRGITKRSHTTERETASLGGRYFTANQTSLLTFTVNTGQLNKELQESLIDLLNCRSLMVMEGQNAIPVIVDGDNVSLPNYRDKLPTAEFTYSYSAKNLTLYRYNKSQRIFDFTFDQSFN